MKNWSWFDKIMVVFMFVVMGVLAYGAYLKYWPMVPAVYHVRPLPIVGGPFHPGDVLPVQFDFTRYVDGPCIGARKLINDTVIPLPTIIGRATTKGHFVFTSTSTFIPRHLQPGTYYLEYTFYYDVNPLRTESVRVTTVPFQVVQ